MILKTLPPEDLWSLPWQEFEVALGRKNALSLRSLNIEDADRATTFFRGCGFDLAHPTHARELEQLFGEAVFFIRHVLLTDDERLRFPLPHELASLDDIRRLLILASVRTPRRRYVRLWACAALKVMQALANLEFSGKLRELQFARDQIFTRIKSLVRDERKTGPVMRHGSLAVRLKTIDWKDAKTRSSVVLKLLHKPESIVDEVFDYLGVRFVVPAEHDVPLLLRLLVESDIIVPHQVIGMRSRNSLLNLEEARGLLGLSRDLFATGTITREEFSDMTSRVPWGAPSSESSGQGRSGRRANVFTSNDYRAVQLTVRHLVRTPNPAYLVLDSLAGELRHYRGSERDADPLLAGLVPPELTRYFPVEIQIMDESSYDISKFGPASHERYKHLQWLSVRDRVLGSLLKVSEEKLATQEY
jgi:uncharacterized protein (TIGR04552 family)